MIPLLIWLMFVPAVHRNFVVLVCYVDFHSPWQNLPGKPICRYECWILILLLWRLLLLRIGRLGSLLGLWRNLS